MNYLVRKRNLSRPMKDDTKVVLDSGFQALDSGFHLLAEFWIP